MCYIKVHSYPVYSSKHHVLSVYNHTCVCVCAYTVYIEMQHLSCSYIQIICVVTRAPCLSASISSKLICLLYAILMGISIFLDIFCLIKHAKVVLGWLCQMWFINDSARGLSCNELYIYKGKVFL